VNHHLEGVTDFEDFGVDRQRKLAEREYAFGFSADVDEQLVFVFLNDHAVQDLALVEYFKRLFVEALFECELIFLFVCGGDFNRRDVEVPTFNIFYLFAD